MAENKLNRVDLKAYFEAGKIPTDQHFADLISSSINQMDDGIKAENENLILKLNSGKVGIGTPTPTVKLHVKGSVKIDEGLSLTNGADISGKVGIGTNTPSAFLHVKSDQQEIARFEGGGHNEVSIQLQSSAGNSYAIAWYNRQGGKLALWTGADALTIDRSQNVGIGANNPESKLHVNGKVTLESGKEIFFKDNGQIRSRDDHHRILFRRTDNILELREYGKIIFSAGSRDGTEKKSMVIEANGNVSIGKTDASANLHVYGQIEDKKGILMPTGAIIAFGGNTPPKGWKLCNGDWLNKDDFHDLFRALVHAQKRRTGPSNSIEQFQLPDLRSRFIVGAGQGKGLSNYPIGLGENKGKETHRMTAREMPSHNHSGETYWDGAHSHTYQRVAKADNDDNDGTGYYIGHRSSGHTEPDKFQDITSYGSAHKHSLKIESNGGSQPHNNLPPYYALTYIIKY